MPARHGVQSTCLAQRRRFYFACFRPSGPRATRSAGMMLLVIGINLAMVRTRARSKPTRTVKRDRHLHEDLTIPEHSPSPMRTAPGATQ